MLKILTIAVLLFATAGIADSSPASITPPAPAAIATPVATPAAMPAEPAATPAPAASALPFKPPSGWVNMLDKMPVPAFHGIWTGPKSGSTTSNVSIVSQAFAGTVEHLTNQTKLIGASMLKSKVTAQRSGTICSFPAAFLTVSKPLGVDTLIMDQAMYVANGTAYTLNYTRGATQAADAHIPQLLASLCPDQIESGKIAFPPGWSVNKAQDMHLAGMWANPANPGQVVNLISMPYTDTLDHLTIATVKNAIPGGESAKVYKILSSKDSSVCGLPARLLSVKMNFGVMAMRLEQEATIFNGKAYVVTYGRMDGRPADPAALASMKTLCPR